MWNENEGSEWFKIVWPAKSHCLMALAATMFKNLNPRKLTASKLNWVAARVQQLFTMRPGH